ncbi:MULTISPECIES: TonB-dependent receptor [unclassified Cellvibrio]|uniref:TonB-dependent receptor n=1 Tax=unclassified Cellvibrio TaxID=2624793 RepID=UPI000780E41F|nr:MULTISPECIES: TonB-dependent receptor [unclassified Cellvibrio]
MKRKVLSVAIATVVGTLTSSAVLAQDNSVEEVVVTGIRGSLERSMDVKRESSGVVDAISAEDMGKFPDTNLAESLQRITGVSINRQNGEGSRVTVRGFGPDFNLVTLNNRYMPAAATDRNVNSSRAFNFNEIAAEAVSGVEVYKTAKANVASGGIGATINIKTAKPFDLNETKAVVSFKGVADTVEEGDSITPELSGIFSTKFADDKVGVLINASYQERDNREQISATDGWLPSSLNGIPAANLDLSATQGNADWSGSTWMPQNYNVDISDHERKRLNAQGVVQFAATDTVTATLDYTMSHFEDDINRNQLGIWFNGGAGVTGKVDENGTLTSFTQTNSNTDFFGYTDHIETENESVGFNLEWQTTDSLNLNLDIHSSESVAQPDRDANEQFVISGQPGVTAITMDYGNGKDLPGMVINDTNYRDGSRTLPDGTPITGGIYDLASVSSLFVAANATYQKTEVDQVQLNGVWDNASDDALKKVGFGLGHVDYTTNTQRRQSQRSTGYYGGFPFEPVGNIDTSYWKAVDISGLLDGFSGTENLPSQLYSYDVKRHIADLESLYDPLRGQNHPAYGDLVIDNYLTTLTDADLKQDHIINEKTTSAYVQLDFESEFNGMPLNTVAGVRYEHTEVNASSLVPNYTNMRWNSGNEMSMVREDTKFYSDVDSEYDVFLPNLDVSLEFVEDLVGRFSYGKSLSRPDLNAMRETFTPGETKAFTNLTANKGNSALLPYLAQNLDLSLEWYYADSSYASAGYYRKIVDNFIVTREEIVTIPGVRNPANGPRAAEAIAQVTAAGGDPTDQAQVLAQVQANDVASGGSGIIVGNSDDPLAEFRTTLPKNEESATIDGWEFNIQHVFGESGFGASANYTLVNGDVEYDVNKLGEAFALTGLSDSANLSGFYENHGIQVRLAYNWRDEFLAGIGQLRVANEPTFVEEYGQWDLNVSYEINEMFTVFVEGLNITDEVQRAHGRWENQLVFARQYGPRYNIGVRATF